MVWESETVGERFCWIGIREMVRERSMLRWRTQDVDVDL